MIFLRFSSINRMFLKPGRHNRCPVRFVNHIFSQEYAHAWALPKSEIHFNDDKPFVPVGWALTPAIRSAFHYRRFGSRPISLLKVALFCVQILFEFLSPGQFMSSAFLVLITKLRVRFPDLYKFQPSAVDSLTPLRQFYLSGWAQFCGDHVTRL